MADVTYLDKDKNANDGVRNLYRDIDANEVKQSVNSKVDKINGKEQLGISKVDNTSDLEKPISLLTQSALDGKQEFSSSLTQISQLSPSEGDILLYKLGGWTNRNIEQSTGESIDSVMSQNAVTLAINTATSNIIGTAPPGFPADSGDTLGKLHTIIVSMGRLRGEFDASGGVIPGSPGNWKGDFWRVAIGGTVSGLLSGPENLNPGDLLYSNEDESINANQFFSVRANNSYHAHTVSDITDYNTATDFRANARISASVLDSFADVTITSPVTGQTLRRIGAVWVNSQITFVMPEDYGAIGDGSTNDSYAIQSAIDSGYPVLFTEKNYRVTSTITITDNTKLVGSGAGSIISTTSNIRILTIAGSDNTVENLTFLGNVSGANQTGVYVEGVVGLTSARNNNMIINCRLNSLTFGMYVRYANLTTSIHYGSVKVVNTIAKGNTYGFYLFTRAEYSNFIGCSAISNTTGLDIEAGNVNWIGGQVTDNVTGVYVGAGANDGHGVVSGALINHNTTNVQAVNVTTNFLFTSCMLYSGNIVLTTSDGIQFKGCEMSVTTITSTNSTDSEFSNCKFETTPTFSITGTSPIFFNNTYEAGIPTSLLLGNTFKTPIILDNDITPTALSANTDNYAPTSGVNATTIRISSTTPVDLTGLSLSQVDGIEITIINVGANTITLKSNISSTAANRFLLTADYSLLAEQAIRLLYDGISARWRKLV